MMASNNDPALNTLGVRAAQLVRLFSSATAQDVTHTHDTLSKIADEDLLWRGRGWVVRRDECGHFVHLPDLDGPVCSAIHTGFVTVRWDLFEVELLDTDDPIRACLLRLTVHGTLAREELGRFLSCRDGRN